jgi:hypothetical protein
VFKQDYDIGENVHILKSNIQQSLLQFEQGRQCTWVALGRGRQTFSSVVPK